MLEELTDTALWNDFLNHKQNTTFVDREEVSEISDFISSGRFLPICEGIIDGSYHFSLPRKYLIAKNSSGKKRTVYSYSDDEMTVLKFFSFLLSRYDCLFERSLYSYRKGLSAKNAIQSLSNIHHLRSLWGYKLDISNYFNSIDVDILLDKLENDIDKDAFDLLKQLLVEDRAVFQGTEIVEKKGAMAGTPFSNFIANYYLKELDRYFWQKDVVYMRYGDDIILFAKTQQELNEYKGYLQAFLSKNKLSVNKEKEYDILPSEAFDFLGYQFRNGKIDISPHSVGKMKGKIRRKARALRRWYIRKGISADKALVAMNKIFNYKFYGKDADVLSWKYWYFPYITSDVGLKSVDEYMQQMQRYIVSGRFNKHNFSICPYERLKRNGYKPLVAAYYEFKAIEMPPRHRGRAELCQNVR